VAAERRSADRRRIAVHAAPAARARPKRACPVGQAGPCGEQEHREAPLKQLRRSGNDDGLARPRILIIDDDGALSETIREALREDYAVASVRHGAAALDLVTVHEPALILLDLRMPIMDGWSFVQQYRRVAVVPAAIVLMSAASDLPTIARQLGADGYLLKPFDLGTLDTCVATQLDRRSMTASDDDGSRADRPSSPPLS
jgi:CheY-like chemotaxis protein